MALFASGKQSGVVFFSDLADLSGFDNVEDNKAYSLLSEGRTFVPILSSKVESIEKINFTLAEPSGLQADTDGHLKVKLAPNSGARLDPGGLKINFPPPEPKLELTENGGLELDSQGKAKIKTIDSNGVIIDDDGVIAINPDEPLELTTEGLSIKTAKGLELVNGAIEVKPVTPLELTEDGLEVKLFEGLEVTPHGLSVKIEPNGGLSLTSTGLAVIPTSVPVPDPGGGGGGFSAVQDNDKLELAEEGGLELDNDGKARIQIDTTNGVKLDNDGALKLRVENPIELTDDGIALKINNHFELTDEGLLSIKLGPGLVVSDQGVGLRYGSAFRVGFLGGLQVDFSGAVSLDINPNNGIELDTLGAIIVKTVSPISLSDEGVTLSTGQGFDVDNEGKLILKLEPSGGLYLSDQGLRAQGGGSGTLELSENGGLELDSIGKAEIKIDTTNGLDLDVNGALFIKTVDPIKLTNNGVSLSADHSFELNSEDALSVKLAPDGGLSRNNNGLSVNIQDPLFYSSDGELGIKINFNSMKFSVYGQLEVRLKPNGGLSKSSSTGLQVAEDYQPNLTEYGGLVVVDDKLGIQTSDNAGLFVNDSTNNLTVKIDTSMKRSDDGIGVSLKPGGGLSVSTEGLSVTNSNSSEDNQSLTLLSNVMTTNSETTNESLAYDGSLGVDHNSSKWTIQPKGAITTEWTLKENKREGYVRLNDDSREEIVYLRREIEGFTSTDFLQSNMRVIFTYKKEFIGTNTGYLIFNNGVTGSRFLIPISDNDATTDLVTKKAYIRPDDLGIRSMHVANFGHDPEGELIAGSSSFVSPEVIAKQPSTDEGRFVEITSGTTRGTGFNIDIKKLEVFFLTNEITQSGERVRDVHMLEEVFSSQPLRDQLLFDIPYQPVGTQFKITTPPYNSLTIKDKAKSELSENSVNNVFNKHWSPGGVRIHLPAGATSDTVAEFVFTQKGYSHSFNDWRCSDYDDNWYHRQ